MSNFLPSSFSSIPLKMQNFNTKPKTHLPSNLKKFISITGLLCIIYLLASLIFVPKCIKHIYSSTTLQNSPSDDTSLQHIIFGIASNKDSWLYRKEYVRLWWRPNFMRGCVFLDAMPPNTTTTPSDAISLPPICMSTDTSSFRYTHKWGHRSAIRLARIVTETVALNHPNVRWLVFCDDDTIIFPENLVKTLGKYDHGLWYYIGTNSEVLGQNQEYSFDMAFGGAGLAISYPLAKVFAKVFDSCLQRYPHLYGSDARIYSCMSELGVTLTHEPGFHQPKASFSGLLVIYCVPQLPVEILHKMDIRGNMFGLLAAHPIKPLVSLHHIDTTYPIFPRMNRLEALKHLFEATKLDSQRILQQTVCYDKWYSWTISISWGYAVQVFRNHVHLPDALRIQQTFEPWKEGPFDIIHDTKEYHPDPDPCQRPVVFFLDKVKASDKGITSIYKTMSDENCTVEKGSPRKIRKVQVYSQRLDQSIKQLQAPRRQCCDLLHSSAAGVLNLSIRECGEKELIYMHS